MELKSKRWMGWKGWLVGALAVLVVAVSAIVWLNANQAAPREAPEAEAVLAAQGDLPFQVLIPAYLPRVFDRTRTRVEAGAEVITIQYPTRKGQLLTLEERLAPVPAQDPTPSSGTAQTRTVRCHCQCRSRTECDLSGMEVTIGPVQIQIGLTGISPLAMEDVQFILNTLGPATNRLVYTSIQDVPGQENASKAVAIPINAQGVQEVTLVVTPQGYSPSHFVVKRNVPVRVIFRQLGQVGCGDELIFAWGTSQSTQVKLTSADDSQVIEFTPTQKGDFRFQCPHQIYQGVMTVQD
jgi:hypothetical protein